jgi:hypothetical protein
MSTYDQLRKIIPADQALACKALQAGLEQIKTIFDTTLPVLANATVAMETTRGLPAIESLSRPLPANVIAFYTTQFYNGSGPNGTLFLTDLIGTPTGCVINPSLNTVTSTLTDMTLQGAFASLTNPSNGVYTVMENTAAGIYTFDDGTGNFITTIPNGLPGAGTYGPSGSEEGSIADAFAGGLNPAMISVVGTITVANPAQVSATNSAFANICIQITTEDTNLALANVDFANLVAGETPWSLVYNLNSDGLDTREGGSAYVLESLSNTATQGGQAIIGSMREARNQSRLNTAGLGTDITVSSESVEPQADLSTGTYTVSEAVTQKIV